MKTLCEKFGVKCDTVKYRLKHGYSIERALDSKPLWCGKDFTKNDKYKIKKVSDINGK